MMIKVSNISKSFYQGSNHIHLFKDFNLHVKEGETLALVGPSGSGKTTLLSLLAGLEYPDAGQIEINNKDITQMSESEITYFRARNMSIVFQHFYLMPHLTALENVMLPLEILQYKDSVKRAKEILNEIQLGNRLHHLPSQLSGGEQQRVAIARASVTKPKVIFADEPTGNLDIQSSKTAMDMLFYLVERNKMTLILVTHNEKLAKRCQRQIDITSQLS